MALFAMNSALSPGTLLLCYAYSHRHLTALRRCPSAVGAASTRPIGAIHGTARGRVARERAIRHFGRILLRVVNMLAIIPETSGH